METSSTTTSTLSSELVKPVVPASDVQPTATSSSSAVVDDVKPKPIAPGKTVYEPAVFEPSKLKSGNWSITQMESGFGWNVNLQYKGKIPMATVRGLVAGAIDPNFYERAAQNTLKLVVSDALREDAKPRLIEDVTSSFVQLSADQAPIQKTFESYAKANYGIEGGFPIVTKEDKKLKQKVTEEMGISSCIHDKDKSANWPACHSVNVAITTVKTTDVSTGRGGRGSRGGRGGRGGRSPSGTAIPVLAQVIKTPICYRGKWLSGTTRGQFAKLLKGNGTGRGRVFICTATCMIGGFINKEATGYLSLRAVEVYLDLLSTGELSEEEKQKKAEAYKAMRADYGAAEGGDEEDISSSSTGESSTGDVPDVTAPPEIGEDEQYHDDDAEDVAPIVKTLAPPKATKALKAGTKKPGSVLPTATPKKKMAAIMAKKVVRKPKAIPAPPPPDEVEEGAEEEGADGEEEAEGNGEEEGFVKDPQVDGEGFTQDQ